MSRVRAFGVVLVLAACSGQASAASRLLDVPYLPQSEDLCGGAALAMVMRYWGARQVFPDDFAALVDRSRAGIVTTALTGAARTRGWTPLLFSGAAGSGPSWLDDHIARGRPVLALIAVGPERFHYVVVVAATATHVVVHDPASAPFRVLPLAAFERAWGAADRWAVVLLPPPSLAPSLASPPSSLPTSPSTTDADACAALVAAMVTRAKAGDLSSAEPGLVTATTLCPRSAQAWRELAGLRFLQSRWTDASTHAALAAELDPQDASTWDLLATSRFLDGAPGTALAAWNRIGQPMLDLVRITGATRTRQPVIATLLRLPPRALVTPEVVARAGRRLEALPSAALTRVTYRPLEQGLAEIEAVVVERPRLPRGLVPVAVLLAHAAVQRELTLDIASPTGSGELLSVAGRIWPNRPRAALSLALPAVAGLPGVVTIDGSWERQSYALGPGGGAAPLDIARPVRHHAAIALADWATSRTWWSGSAAFDRWDSVRHVSLAGAVDQRLVHDRLAVGMTAAAWAPLASGTAGRLFAQSGLSLAARSDPGASLAWQARSGLTHATARAPLDLWPGAGTGLARAPLLRAHPLLAGGVITGPAFGRTLAHATVEVAPVLRRHPAATLRLAFFADTARTLRRLAPQAAPAWLVDAGTGLRVTLPGKGGSLRLDLARGLRDRRTALSAGWQPAWPGR